ncbi:DUF6754 domain-containing protein [Planctomicrobium sp. SH664]|uniref:DUF6754 domain-containing protein n=1 Tax=Planctomicrobium sp. SH664 TaxID=3448125 RepID=UPI003F5B3828
MADPFRKPFALLLVTAVCGICLFSDLTTSISAAPPLPPLSVRAWAPDFDNGSRLKVEIELPEQAEVAPGSIPIRYVVQRSGEEVGLYDEELIATPTPRDLRDGTLQVVLEKCIRGEPYWIRVAAINGDDEKSAYVMPTTGLPVRTYRSWFDGSRFWMLIVTLAVCGGIVAYILIARSGQKLYVRPIAGLDAIEEAVGRATEMGRSCLFVPGIQDMNEVQTIAGLTILSRVAERAAEYDCRIETPTSRSLVMTAARDIVETAYLTAGRPDAYNPDDVYYVTDEQFAYVSAVTGKMVREKPAACFYLGSFYAESLILAETGNAIGAIQIAGTAQPAQLPFFVAACDYTLIGEEFFAASAYLSKDPDQLGSLKGQDFGKIILAALLFIGLTLVTLADLANARAAQDPFAARVAPALEDASAYFQDSVLSAGG